MLDNIDAIATYGMIFAGTVHAVLTPLFSPSLDLDSLWFAGTGLAVITLGVLNIARRRSAETSVKRLCLVANVLSLGYVLVLAFVIGEPHVYLVAAFVGAATIASSVPSHRLGLEPKH